MFWPRSHHSFYSYIRGGSGSGPTFVWMHESRTPRYADVESELWWQLTRKQSTSWYGLAHVGRCPASRAWTPLLVVVCIGLTWTPAWFLKMTGSGHNEGLFTSPCYCERRIAGCFSGRFSYLCCPGPGLWWVNSGRVCCSAGIRPLASCLSLSSLQLLDPKNLHHSVPSNVKVMIQRGLLHFSSDSAFPPLPATF